MTVTQKQLIKKLSRQIRMHVTSQRKLGILVLPTREELIEDFRFMIKKGFTIQSSYRYVKGLI